MDIQAEYAIVRLGKDSVSDIKYLDSYHADTEDPVALTVTCTQVPSVIGPGWYAFLYLGSDNSKGAPTHWTQGLRAIGKIVNKKGGIKYADKCKLKIEVGVIFPNSIGSKDFLRKAADFYRDFCGMPVIGLNTYSNQTVQQIKITDPTQNVSALFQAIEILNTDFKIQIENKYPELLPAFQTTAYSEEITSSENTRDLTEGEKLEGLDNISGSIGWGSEYPLDSVFVRKDQRTVNEIMGRMEKGRYILDPDFQRDFVWSLKKQSRLIESCLMRLPLPVFYFAEAKDGKIIVVDGLQRLTTFQRYFGNKFALVGLDEKREKEIKDQPLLNKKFKDLPLNLQERLEDTQLTLYILDSKAPERARLDIFERVNGGVPLTRQQMRNCLYNGQATTWLKTIAASGTFIDTTGGSLDKNSMRDREVINRFCAFYLLGIERYKGDMDDYLATALEMMNTLDKVQIEKLTVDFNRSLKINQLLFGKHAFRKSLAEQSKDVPRNVLNIALFDVCTVLFASYEESIITKHAHKIQSSIRALFKNEDFIQSITYGTNGVSQVTTRFKLIEKAISEAI